MAKSVRQLQDETLSYLDRIGVESSSVRESVSIGIQKLLEDSAINFVLKVQENLNQSGKIDTGGLSGEIVINPVEQIGNSFNLTIGYPTNSKAAKYYDFVNKGVKGVKSGQPADSPYSFKNDRPGLSMTSALSSWLKRQGVSSRNETQKKGLSPVQRKRKRLSKMIDQNKQIKSLAYATAVSIKRKGLKKTGYFDKAIQFSFGKDFTEAVAKVLGREIVINIKANGNNNK